jgi:CBS domain-containing protein
MTSPVITVTPETHWKEAAALMAEHGVSGLPVVDPESRVVGIVSEADLLPLETSPDPRAQATPLPPRTMPLPTRVADIMTAEVYAVDEDTDLGLVAQRMIEAGVKRFPVLRGDRLVGVISRHDLVKVMARTDAEVAAQVRGALAEEALRLQGLDVQVRDGVVTLASSGDSSTLRLAEIVTRSVPGVLDVRLKSQPADDG